MEELKQKIKALEEKEGKTPMQEMLLGKLKKDLEEGVSSRNTLLKEPKSMFFEKKDDLKVEKITTKAILPNPYQPRRHFRETEIVDLAASIKSKGLIEPIAVTKRNNETVLIAGQKRLKAYIHLNELEEKEGLEPMEMKYLHIPCFILNLEKESDIAILSIAENMARENPFVLDTARAIKTLFDLLKIDEPFLSQNKYAEMAKEYFGIKSKGTISKYLQIADIDETVQDELFKKGVDSFTELYELAKSNMTTQEQIEAINQDKLLKAKQEERGRGGTTTEKEGATSGEEQGTKNKPSKPKTKIDITYLIDTIKNMSTTDKEDIERLKEELIDYLLEFGE
ncbi:MAG: ParB N-terminal domain-containing protein [Sulfurimonas sp.]|uniref:ParB/RepB/Spo0J family partition protein n=1 Tax=Sulfurimonas sp. TaxID=2022749 RepID=UPI002604F391|nr:ParB N-terminal domain-containing protein [Sulfurimonas sp.]MDD5373282.1 ParB N-terminal domain-containing protein [Sulfurimonas sp.]